MPTTTTAENAAADGAFGRVRGLWRYPVKSMAPEPLEEVDASWHGLAGDRRWAFVRDGAERSGFPWLTIRQRSDMAQYRPRFLERDDPDSSPTVVRTPGGEELEVVDSRLAAEIGTGARAIRQNRGVFDEMPLSLITTESVGSLEAMVGRRLGVERFRPNLLVETATGSAFPEDEWVGSVLSIGDLRMRIDQLDERCVVVNVEPHTGERDPAVLRTIARQHGACLGVYGSTVRPGRVAVGDPVGLADP